MDFTKVYIKTQPPFHEIYLTIFQSAMCSTPALPSPLYGNSNMAMATLKEEI